VAPPTAARAFGRAVARFARGFTAGLKACSTARRRRVRQLVANALRACFSHVAANSFLPGLKPRFFSGVTRPIRFAHPGLKSWAGGRSSTVVQTVCRDQCRWVLSRILMEPFRGQPSRARERAPLPQSARQCAVGPRPVAQNREVSAWVMPRAYVAPNVRRSNATSLRWEHGAGRAAGACPKVGKNVIVITCANRVALVHY